MIDASQHNNEARDAEWYGICNQLVASLRVEGEVIRHANRQGYGGISAGNCFIGRRIDGDHLHIGGSRASVYFAGTYRRSLHYSRLDLQVTTRSEERDQNYGERQKQLAMLENSRISRARQRDIRYMSSSKGGYTLYIGSSKSDQMGRLYDKAAESGDEAYNNCWRWEIQLRNDKATRAAVYLMEECENIEQGVITTVYDWFQRRGCQPDFAPGEIPACDFVEPKAKTDLAKQIEWLYTQVRPSVKRLCEAGYRTEVLKALGLTDEEGQAIEFASANKGEG